MRYIMKGGVWKNSEDQILKAAIMKYGLNQWSRISSLLQRKSAKQCKQRWYEWLDPSIKKTQWSRVEDQKLLHLTRIFPSQWRTIAPFVGRTPTQCFERYQKLLDQAQGKTGQQTEDLKRLRPGQIDPNPETKPARLDPIDMDEDQKEMLAEVRVRLANTKGKKAKRKQREKIIEQARRLAQLQKIRQLQMAGVENIPTAKEIKRMRQKQDIDYNKQIPFKRQAPQFVYKLQSNETSKNTFFASTISLQTLEGKRRDVQEELQRKIDKKRIKRLKDTDYKAMMALKNKFDKPASMPIQLPEPQLNEKDLEDMKRYNITTPLNSVIQNTPAGMTPDNKIMLSARINFSLNHKDMMTPVGEEEDQVDGVEGLNYLKMLEKNEKDPNRLRSVDRIISERVKTPMSQDWQQNQNKVKSLFKNLRRPENILQFQIPQQQDENQMEEEQEQKMVDAEQQQKFQAQQERKKNEQKNNLRNEALKLGLPRVKKIQNSLIPSQQGQINKMIEKEILNMMYSDSIDYPLNQFSIPENHQFQYLSNLSFQKKRHVKQLIDKQMQNQQNFMLCETKYEDALRHIVFDSKTKKVKISGKILKEDQFNKQKTLQEISSLPIYNQLEKSTQSLEKKCKKYLGGYQKLISTKIQEINSLQEELQKQIRQRKTLELMYETEQRSAVSRLSREQAYYQHIYSSI